MNMDISKELDLVIELVNNVNTTNTYLLKGVCPDKAKDILLADNACLLITLSEDLQALKAQLNSPTNIKAA